MLVNVAGVYQLWDDKPFTEQSAHDLMSYFQVNVVVRVELPPLELDLPIEFLTSISLQGPFLASKAFLPALSRAKTPKIINVSSDMASIEGKLGD